MKSRLWIIGLFAFLFITLSMSFNYLGGDWEFVVYEGQLVVSQETITEHWVPLYSVYLTVFIALGVEFLSSLNKKTFLQNTKLQVILLISGYVLLISDRYVKLALGIDFELLKSLYYVMLSLFYMLGSISLILLLINKFKTKFPQIKTYFIAIGVYVLLNVIVYLLFIGVSFDFFVNRFMNPLYIFQVMIGNFQYVFVTYTNNIDILSKLFYTIDILLLFRLYIVLGVAWVLTKRIYTTQ